MKISFKSSSFDYLKKGLAKLEIFLADYVQTLDGLIKEALENTLIVGGKRIRPALFMICAKNESYNIGYLLPASASIEIIHTASLIHDDIIDKSVLRRGKKTIHNIYDRDTAKFVGDYLFTHAFWLLNSYNNSRILLEMAEAADLLVKGEFDQLKAKKDIMQSEEDYFNKINEKTSSLFKLSCALGGMLSGSDENDVKNMRRFGEYIGASFQINDDLLDIDVNSNELKLGKPVGNDLRQGNITLPYIYGMEDSDFKTAVEAFIAKNKTDSRDLKKVLKLLAKTGSIKKTREKFKFFLDKAREAAGLISGQQRKSGLYAICDLIEKGIKSSI